MRADNVDPRLAQLHQPIRTVAASRPQCARGQAPDDRRLPRRRGRVPRHAARRGQYSFDQHRDLPRPQRRLHQVGGGRRLCLSRPGRWRRPLRAEQAHHRNAGVPGSLSGGARPHARGGHLGCVQLADQPDRRAHLYRGRSAAHAGGAACRPPQRISRASRAMRRSSRTCWQAGHPLQPYRGGTGP